MGGSVLPDRTKVCECGGRFVRIADPEYHHPVPRCEICHKPPGKLRVRITLPPPVGKIDIRYNSRGNYPLTTSKVRGSNL